MNGKLNPSIVRLTQALRLTSFLHMLGTSQNSKTLDALPSRCFLFNNLNPQGKKLDIEVIFSGDKSKTRVVGRFAPKANPEYHFTGGECELITVIATDVLAEGLNLQDCDKIINYDLHWNPVRLIQRFGRIDRIGSDYDVIYGFNFLPETGIERNLGLQQKLHNRIQEIHDTIGEDSAILDRTEMLNPLPRPQTVTWLRYLLLPGM